MNRSIRTNRNVYIPQYFNYFDLREVSIEGKDQLECQKYLSATWNIGCWFVHWFCWFIMFLLVLRCVVIIIIHFTVAVVGITPFQLRQIFQILKIIRETHSKFACVLPSINYLFTETIITHLKCKLIQTIDRFPLTRQCSVYGENIYDYFMKLTLALKV